VSARPGEYRGLARLEVLLEEIKVQALFYVVDFSSSCVSALARPFLAPAGFYFVFAEDFEVAFFRVVFDERSPPSVLPSSLPLASALAAAA
jgi:hypothetical protein